MYIMITHEFIMSNSNPDNKEKLIRKKPTKTKVEVSFTNEHAVQNVNDKTFTASVANCDERTLIISQFDKEITAKDNLNSTRNRSMVSLSYSRSF